MIIAQLELTDPKQLGHTHIRVGGKDFVVSTVKLPCMHPNGLFETMVFPADEDGVVASWTDNTCRRAETEELAMFNHGDACLNFGGA